MKSAARSVSLGLSAGGHTAAASAFPDKVVSTLQRFVGRLRRGVIRALGVLILSHLLVLGSGSPLAAQDPVKGKPALPGEPCQIEAPRDPKTKEFKWTEPEIWVWKRVCEGESADFNKRYGFVDTNTMGPWTEERQLSATFLETILLHEPYRGALTRNGVRIVGAWFRQPVDLEGSTLDRQLWLDKSRFESNVSLLGLKSSELISLQGSKFTGTLDMDSMEVGGNLFMRGGAEFGGVVLRSAKIASTLDMDGSKFTGKLDMASMGVGSHLFMRGAEFGVVDLRSAKIGGQLAMTGSKFTGTLIMASMEVGGALLMHGGAEFGEVLLRGAKIGDQLSMLGSKFTGRLTMDSMEVGGDLFMRRGDFAKPVSLIFTKIGSSLDLSGAKFAALDLTGTRIGGELRLGPAQHAATEWRDGAQLTLRNTVVDAWQDQEDAWPESLELEGFTYKRLGGFGAAGATDIADRKTKEITDRETKWFTAWLAKDESYSPQPYEQLAGVLRTAGQEGKAGDILYAGRKRGYDRKPLGVGKFFEYLEMSFIGFGYRNWYAAVWIAIFVALGAMFLAWSGDFRDATEAKEVRNKWRALWPGIKRFVGKDLYYSFDMLLPIIHLRESHYDTNIQLRPSVEAYFVLHKLMGYVLGSFLIAGLSGLTK